MMRLQLLLALLAAALCRCACSGAERWQEVDGGRWRSLTIQSSTTTGFTLLPGAATGIRFTNSLEEARAATNRVLYNGSGVAVADFDGDGLPDIFFAALEAPCMLYQNQGNWRFREVTAQVGLEIHGMTVRGAAFADINGDGRPDLLLTTVGHGTRCYLNAMPDGFVDVTPLAGTGSGYGSSTVAIADIDGNGTLDLYIANNRAEDIRDRGAIDLKLVGGQMIVPPALQDRLVIMNGELREYGEPDQLFLGDGNGRFRLASWTNGTFLTRPSTISSGSHCSIESSAQPDLESSGQT